MRFIFDEEKCRFAKEHIGRNGEISKVWMTQFSPKNKIGNCTNLFRKLKPTSPEDFYEKYIKYAEEHHTLPVKERGLTYEELLLLAGQYCNAGNAHSKVNYEADMYFYDMLCHIILETWEGQRTEREFSRFLEKLDYKCDHFDGEVDATYGLDIRVRRKDGKVSAIQIKPMTFFLSNRPDVVEHRRLLCKKYERTYEDMNGLKTYYAVYCKDKQTGEITWVKNGDGFRFKINELFIYDPRNVEGTFHDKQVIKWDSPREKLPI